MCGGGAATAGAAVWRQVRALPRAKRSAPVARSERHAWRTLGDDFDTARAPDWGRRWRRCRRGTSSRACGSCRGSTHGRDRRWGARRRASPCRAPPPAAQRRVPAGGGLRLRRGECAWSLRRAAAAEAYRAAERGQKVDGERGTRPHVALDERQDADEVLGGRAGLRADLPDRAAAVGQLQRPGC